MSGTADVTDVHLDVPGAADGHALEVHGGTGVEEGTTRVDITVSTRLFGVDFAPHVGCRDHFLRSLTGHDCGLGGLVHWDRRCSSRSPSGLAAMFVPFLPPLSPPPLPPHPLFLFPSSLPSLLPFLLLSPPPPSPSPFLSFSPFDLLFSSLPNLHHSFFTDHPLFPYLSLSFSFRGVADQRSNAAPATACW